MMKLNLLIISFLLFVTFSYAAKPITIESLDKHIIKLTSSNIKKENNLGDLLSNAKENFAKSKILKDEGDLLIELAQKGQIESLNKYTSFISQMGKAQNSKALKQEIKYLDKLLSSWQSYDDKNEEGESLVKKSIKLNVKGIKANDKASELIVKLEKDKAQLNQYIKQKEQLQNEAIQNVQ